MSISSRLISYFEVTPGSVVQIGAGEADDIVWSASPDAYPSVRFCVREPLHPSGCTRMQFSLATMTKHGPLPRLSTEPAQLLGAWGAAVWRALKVVEALADSDHPSLMALPTETKTTWWLVDSITTELTPIGAPDHSWLQEDASKPELLRHLLIRVSGSADAILDLLRDARQEIAQPLHETL
jgi:hypothetical protein